MTCLPKACRPAGEAEEKELLTTIIEEITRGLAIDLDPTPTFERGVPVSVGGDGGGGQRSVLIVGDLGAEHQQAALRESGFSTDLLQVASWRIMKTNVERLLASLKAALERKVPDAVVFQFMDNSVYAGLSEEGIVTPPKRQGDQLHIEGDLTVCEKPVLNKLLLLCKPILEAMAGIKTVLIGPLPHYVAAGCCDNATQIPNRRGPRFLEDILEDLEGIHKTMRDYLFKESLRHIRVMNPRVGLRGLSPSNIWGDNPVQIRKEVMVHLAEGVKITLNKITIKRRRDSVEPAEQKKSGRGGGGGPADEEAEWRPGEPSEPVAATETRHRYPSRDVVL
jgi:hypothetical protein